MTPLAVPGRWRTSTRPATLIRLPSLAVASILLGVTPNPSNCSRSSETGWARSDRPIA